MKKILHLSLSDNSSKSINRLKVFFRSLKIWDFAHEMLDFRATKTLLAEEIKVHIWHLNHAINNYKTDHTTVDVLFPSHHSTDDNKKLHNSLLLTFILSRFHTSR